MKLVIFPIKIFIGIILLTCVITFSTENKSKSAITSTAASSSSSESNMNHGIFLNARLFKNKNLKKNLSKSKSKTASTNKNTVANKAATTTAAKTKSSTTLKNPNPNPNPPKKPENAQSNVANNKQKTHVFEGPILHKGWIKFFKYSAKNGVDAKHPNSFKENRQFFEQAKHFPNADLKTKKDGFFEFIRDNHYFFLSLFENLIAINSSLYVRTLNFFLLNLFKKILGKRKKNYRPNINLRYYGNFRRLKR